jgi:hypothetical protein
VASRKQRKKKAKAKSRARAAGKPADALPSKERPTPVQAIESKHAELAASLARRSDRFSQVLAKSFRDERAGQHLVTRNDLSAEERDELAALREPAHAEFRAELVAAIERLRQLLRQGDPLHSVAVVQVTNLMGTWGGYYEPTERGGENSVELVAGLVASQVLAPDAEALPDAEMQHVFEELSRILELVFLVNFTNRRDGDPREEALRFTSAMHWMSIRGNSFGDHGRELAIAVFTPFDQWMTATYAFTIADAIEVGDIVVNLWDVSVNSLLNHAREFADGVGAYLDDRQRLPREVREKVVTAADRDNAARYAFFDAFRSHVAGATTFTLDELCEARPSLDRDRAAAVLRELSVDIGSIDPASYSGLFDPSPLVEQPFLQHGDRYMLPVPGMLVRDIFTVFDARLMRERPGYPKSQAKTLDRLAVELLASALPGAEIYTNLHYGPDELDGLVLFEDIAFVVEGKGSAISFQARRGDLERLVNEIRRSVEEALDQGVRARDFILAPGDSVFFDGHGSELVRLSDGAIREVHIVNPTIHELAGNALQLTQFRSRGLFPTGELPWSIYINDLRVIVETCDNPAIFLHYLTWRSRFALGEEVIVSDELDLWGTYLFAARLPPVDENGFHHLGNSTTDFDAYYDGLMDRGPKREAPSKFLEEPARSFVGRMVTDRPPEWRKAAGVLLDLSIPELAFVCAKSKRAGQMATARNHFVEFDFGRGVLIGVPAHADQETVLEYAAEARSDASFFVYAKESGSKDGSIVWAHYGATISFELSEFERRADAASPSAFRD